jgi:hypothetical protein
VSAREGSHFGGPPPLSSLVFVGRAAILDVLGSVFWATCAGLPWDNKARRWRSASSARPSKLGSKREGLCPSLRLLLLPNCACCAALLDEPKTEPVGVGKLVAAQPRGPALQPPCQSLCSFVKLPCEGISR